MAEATQKRKKRLGKGLGGLIGAPVSVPVGPKQQTAVLPKAEVDSSGGSLEGLLHYIEVGLVRPNPNQPRQVFDDEGIAALADSIEAAGLMQPIVVRNSASQKNEFEIVAGERRWRAAQIAGLKTIPAVVKELDDRTSAEWALIENLQREDLNPIDRAEAFDRLVVQFQATQQEIASQLGIDRSSVSNFLRLNDLEDEVKDAVRDKRLTMGHAKVLLGIAKTADCKAIAKKCAAEQWSVRELERQLKKLQGSNKKIIAGQRELTPAEMHLISLASQLGDHLGTKVEITGGPKKGSGKLVISFYDNTQFEGLLDQMNFSAKM